MIDPEFVPSVPEPTQAERAYARGALNDLFKQSLRANPDEELPEDIKDILYRDHATMHERAIFMRDDTRIIPERMLDPEKPLEMNDILAMLNVYFWWSEDQLSPAECLEDLLKDLDDKRFAEAARALHTEFIYLCAGTEGASKKKKHRADGYDCFLNYMRLHGTIHMFDHSTKRAEEVTSWLQDICDDDEDDDELNAPLLASVLGKYIVSTLVDAGADLVEAQDALNVLQYEEERREGNMEGYEDVRDPNISFEEALKDLWPTYLTADEWFGQVVEAYKDLPPNVLNWSQDLKLALARRFVSEHADIFQMLEDTYQLRENGVLPFYWRRFAEDHWPPDQRV